MRLETKEYIKTFEKILNLPGVAWWVIDYHEDPSAFYCNHTMCEFFCLDDNLKKHNIDNTCPIAGGFSQQVKEADESIAMQIKNDYQHSGNDLRRHPSRDETQNYSWLEPG